MKDFEIFAGYHENIVALKGELTEYFSSWQKYGVFNSDEIAEIFFNRGVDSDIIFTREAYNKLKNILGLDDNTNIFMEV